MAHELQPLPYAFDALEPHIDARTMEIHHDRHHRAYVDNLNAALAKHPKLEGRSTEELLRNIDAVPEDVRTAVRNHGGGHHTHALFWQIMAPNGGGAPSGALAPALEALGGVEAVQRQVSANGLGRFGSGRSWVAVERGGGLWLGSTANQDSPLMDGRTPILGSTSGSTPTTSRTTGGGATTRAPGGTCQLGAGRGAPPAGRWALVDGLAASIPSRRTETRWHDPRRPARPACG
jgi:Fe-Mn family superoxide dismutase